MVHTHNNQVISSSQTGQIESVSSTSSENYGNFVISEDIQSAHQAVSLDSGESTKCTGGLLATARLKNLTRLTNKSAMNFIKKLLVKMKQGNI